MMKTDTPIRGLRTGAAVINDLPGIVDGSRSTKGLKSPIDSTITK